MMLTGLLQKLSQLDATKRRSDRNIYKQYRAISRAEAAFEVFLNRMIRKGQVHSVKSKLVKKETKGGRVVFRTKVYFQHKPENCRTRRYVIDFYKRIPTAVAYTDCGPGHERNYTANYNLDNEGLAQFYKEEILDFRYSDYSYIG